MKTIPNYPNYKISKSGEVYSKHLQRKMRHKVSNNYASIGLRKEGKVYFHNIHRLVLMTYSELPDNYKSLQACHNDGNKRNNHISNLRWATPKENTHDKYKHGTAFYCRKGEDHHNSKLNKDLVAKMRTDAKYMNTKQISEKYGVARLTAYDAVVGNSWGCVDSVVSPVDLSGRQGGLKGVKKEAKDNAHG